MEDTPPTAQHAASDERSVLFWLRALRIASISAAMQRAGKPQRPSRQEVIEELSARITAAVSPDDYETTRSSLEAMARSLGWTENAERRPGGGLGFGRGHGCGHGHRHGHGKHHEGTRHEAAYERGFQAGFAAAHRVDPPHAA